MAKPELNPHVADEVPWSEKLTDYDEQHFVTYLRLLDADAAGATDVEMARIILGIEPADEPERAQAALKSHLERARWMTRCGYQHLLKP